MSGILDNITGAVKNLGEGAFGAVQNVGQGAFGAVENIGEGAFGAVKSVGQGALGAVQNVGQGAYGAVSSVGEGAYGAVSSVGEGIGKGVKKIVPLGGKRGKMSKRMLKTINKMNKTLQNKVKSAASYNLAASIGGRRHRGGFSNYSVTSTFPSGIYDVASPYPGDAYGTPLPLQSANPIPTQHFRGGDSSIPVQLPAGGVQLNVQDAAGNNVKSMAIALPSPVNMKVTTGGRRRRTARRSRRGGRKSQKGCSKSWGGRRHKKTRRH